LAAKKAQGVILGNRTNLDAARAKGNRHQPRDGLVLRFDRASRHPGDTGQRREVISGATADALTLLGCELRL
jgi:hypothetical protein